MSPLLLILFFINPHIYSKHAKVEDEATVALSVQLDQADIEAAKAEWETLVLSDCE